MTYRFKCRESGDLLMLQSDGDALLRILGRSPCARGIIEASALPESIAAIEQAIADVELRQAQLAQAAHPGHVHQIDGAVALRQCAWPFLQMLNSAHAAATEVMWGV